MGCRGRGFFLTIGTFLYVVISLPCESTAWSMIFTNMKNGTIPRMTNVGVPGILLMEKWPLFIRVMVL